MNRNDLNKAFNFRLKIKHIARPLSELENLVHLVTFNFPVDFHYRKIGEYGTLTNCERPENDPTARVIHIPMLECSGYDIFIEILE